MVSATVKTNKEPVTYNLPKAHHLTTGDKKFLLKELIIGQSNNSTPNQYYISDGSRILQLRDIAQWVSRMRSTIPEQYKDQMVVLIKADQKVDMGLITDIQQKLRESNARKIVYRTLEEYQ